MKLGISISIGFDCKRLHKDIDNFTFLDFIKVISNWNVIQMNTYRIVNIQNITRWCINYTDCVRNKRSITNIFLKKMDYHFIKVAVGILDLFEGTIKWLSCFLGIISIQRLLENLFNNFLIFGIFPLVPKLGKSIHGFTLLSPLGGP